MRRLNPRKLSNIKSFTVLEDFYKALKPLEFVDKENTRLLEYFCWNPKCFSTLIKITIVSLSIMFSNNLQQQGINICRYLYLLTSDVSSFFPQVRLMMCLKPYNEVDKLIYYTVTAYFITQCTLTH